jgi:hypothetical protein
MNSNAAAGIISTNAPVVKIIEILKILIQNPGYRIKSDYPKD